MYAHLVASRSDKDSQIAPVRKPDRYKFSLIKTSPDIEGEAVLWLIRNDEPVAYVSYDTVLEGGEPHIQVTYISSIEGGRGYARVLMEKLYDDNPSAALIDWGICHHPAALHLAQDFSTRYWNRTAYAEPEEVGDIPF